MSTLERLWTGWRSAYVGGAAGAGEAACVFCDILSSGLTDEDAHVVWRHPSGRVAVLLNAFPYTSGHVMALPTRHVAELEELGTAEAADLWEALALSVRALKTAYKPDGVNVGANLGRAAGAGVPGHFHLHALPRWVGDTNFMTALADTRVLPEALSETDSKLRAAWPAPG